MSLEERTRELIAVGASVTANCTGCVEFHVAKAREYGAEEEEIREAIRVGRLVRRGAGNKFDKFAQAIVRGNPPTTGTCGNGCG